EDAFVRLGETIGLSENTVRQFSKVIQDEFKNAGEAAEAFGALALDAINLVIEAGRRETEQRIAQLERQKDIQLEFAGDSARAREQIEERFAKKKARILNKQAKDEKALSIMQAVVSTAVAVVKALAVGPPQGIVLAAIVGALGAAQIALIASQKIPQFEKGVRNFEGGTAMINEKRQEVVTTPDGKVHRPKGKNLLVNLPKGSDVYKSE